MPGRRTEGAGVGSAIAELYALTHQRATAAAAGSALVFRPGGVTSGNVTETWPAPDNVFWTIQGPKTIQIDDSIVSPAVVPAGTYATQGSLSLLSIANFNNENGGAILQMADGAVLSGVGVLTLGEWLLAQSMSATTPVVTVAASQETNIIVSSFAVLQSTAAAAFFHVRSGGFLWLDLTNCAVGDDAHAMVTVDAGGQGQVNSRESSLRANLFTGAGASAFDIFVDSGTIVGSPLGGGTSVTLSDSALLTGYTPASSANWNNTPPATVAAALDRIAAKIGPIL